MLAFWAAFCEAFRADQRAALFFCRERGKFTEINFLHNGELIL